MRSIEPPNNDKASAVINSAASGIVGGTPSGVLLVGKPLIESVSNAASVGTGVPIRLSEPQ